MELATSIIIGIGLAAACGFRVFVPLLVLSAAAFTDQVTLASGLEWIGSYPALIAFSVATVAEIAGYYIPWVDNLLDFIATPAAVVAGTLMMGAVVGEIDPLFKWALALVAGGGTAGIIQSLTVLTRGASSFVTGGFGNPLISTGEAAGSLAIANLAVFLPWIAIGLVFLFIIGAGSLYFRKKKTLDSPGSLVIRE